MAGRKKKLTAVNKKHLTKEEKEERENIENKASDGFGELQETPPKYFNNLARNEYRRIVKEVKKLPIRGLDRGVLEQYCIWYSVWREAYDNYKKSGIYMTRSYLSEVVWETDGKKKKSQKVNYYIDYSKKNPAIGMMAEASAKIIQSASNLGLTIDSRMKIVAPEEKEESSIFDMFADEDDEDEYND
ncbi:phage terminase small subunit P27 family [Listeria monocytogenes]|uniref:phage terminase small subunit P27 family n=1 Tax=Listeria monocytogenes TaxID=1639 RepID=UPI0009856E37|nr:phage terminase small subunit P27 family [Listeria monocytogenes]EAC2431438.1 phage terminase small subunit P27 family [Listeria monocytogenes]EAC6733269.1 phage terminase small subunit P27 family [Listeria monocytogenes]EAD6458308.1 phage terminase small subunit P27 family [Listeria monocytogenes]EAD6470490.1 phage terminase small subunit P27 family [Listeria monocytogenes]EAD6595139.1 phage terminase small subunit P27 family [Listeria monocytogenes]